MPFRSEEETNTAKESIGVCSFRILVDHLLVGRFDDDLRRGEYRNADIVELCLSLARRQVVVGPRETRGLEVLVGVAIERYRFPAASAGLVD